MHSDRIFILNTPDRFELFFNFWRSERASNWKLSKLSRVPLKLASERFQLKRWSWNARVGCWSWMLKLNVPGCCSFESFEISLLRNRLRIAACDSQFVGLLVGWCQPTRQRIATIMWIVVWIVVGDRLSLIVLVTGASSQTTFSWSRNFCGSFDRALNWRNEEQWGLFVCILMEERRRICRICRICKTRTVYKRTRIIEAAQFG